MTYFNPAINSWQVFPLKFENLNISFIAYIFISSLIAISAMILPGISGSTILLILGLYTPILNAINKVLKLNFEYLTALIIFSVGILVDILLTVRVVRSLLRKYIAGTIYCIIGLMMGSIYSVIIGPTSLEIPKSPMSISTFSIVFFIIGGILVLGLEKLKIVL